VVGGGFSEPCRVLYATLPGNDAAHLRIRTDFRIARDMAQAGEAAVRGKQFVSSILADRAFCAAFTQPPFESCALFREAHKRE
jgi:hypothetical protein